MSKNEETVILGNGPSLSQTIADHERFLEGKDVWAVNFFMKTDIYTRIQPKFYVILSPGYWIKGLKDINEQGRLTAFKELAELTTWEMILYVPQMASRQKEWRKEIDENENITIRYFNNTPVEGIRVVNRFFYRNNLGLPRPHNVLIPCIKLAVDLCYKNIFIVGADHSWLKDIKVDEDNTIYFTQKHFYDKGNEKTGVPITGNTNKRRTLADLLMKFVHTLNSYFELKDYADSRNCKIINATKGSYVDAFERINLDDYGKSV